MPTHAEAWAFIWPLLAEKNLEKIDRLAQFFGGHGHALVLDPTGRLNSARGERTGKDRALDRPGG